MSTLNTLLAGLMTSGTWWIIAQTFVATPVNNEVELRAIQLRLMSFGIRPKEIVDPAGRSGYLVPGLQAFRASCLTTGRFRTANGGSPSFDPATALYATSDMVTNIAAVNNITIHGDVCSARRLLKSEHNWKTFLTLDQALAHPHLGKTMPSRAIIIAAYADDEVIEA